MAMALHATVDPIKLRGNNFLLVIARITASGSYSTGGDTLELKALNPFSAKQPKRVDIFGRAGFIYSYDLANKKVQVWTNSAGGVNLALTEHTAVALVAGVTGDEIIAYVWFA